MNKPFTLEIQEATEKIVETINNLRMPAYILKNILQSIYNEIEKKDNEEIQRYLQEQDKEKESD